MLYQAPKCRLPRCVGKMWWWLWMCVVWCGRTGEDVALLEAELEAADAKAKGGEAGDGAEEGHGGGGGYRDGG